MIAVKYGGKIVGLPVEHPALRQDVRRTYRDWRRTDDKYTARQMATLCALWYTATSHPQVSWRWS